MTLVAAHPVRHVCGLAKTGHAWHTTYLAPSLWTAPSPPVTAVEAVLPPLGSDGSTVEHREVLLDGPEV